MSPQDQVAYLRDALSKARTPGEYAARSRHLELVEKLVALANVWRTNAGSVGQKFADDLDAAFAEPAERMVEVSPLEALAARWEGYDKHPGLSASAVSSFQSAAADLRLLLEGP